jgi:hypothetical protein
LLKERQYRLEHAPFLVRVWASILVATHPTI